jgi:biotin carboxylase
MVRVLLLLPTTTYRTDAFMQAAQRLGVDVTVGSEEPSTMTGLNPSGLLTLDINHPVRAAEQVRQFASQYPISAVVAVDDQVAAAGAAISQALGLPSNSPDAVVASRNKYRMRKLLEAAGVSQPHFQLCSLNQSLNELSRKIYYPCVIKPLDLAASQGVIRANHANEFTTYAARLATIMQNAASKQTGSAEQCQSASAANHHSQLTNRQFLVEEFIAGPEVAVEGMLCAGRLRIIAIFDKPDPLDGPFFEETIYVTPSRHPSHVQAAIADVTAQACRALGLAHGPVHTELRLRDNVDAKVIEVNPRSIGGLCSRVLRFGTGLSLEELIIRQALDPDFTPPSREGQAAGVMMIPIPRAGVLQEVRGLDAAKSVANIEDVVIAARIGQTLVPLPEGSLYLGFIFARAETPDRVEDALRTAHQQIVFSIDSEE